MALRQIEGTIAIVANGAGKSLSKTVLTHRGIEAMKPSADAYRVPDIRCPGLAIRVAPSGVKTWDMAFRIRGASGVKRKALGAFPAVGLDDARDRASALLRAAQAGRDLLAEEEVAKAEAAARMTVDELIEEYLKRACGKLRTRHEIKLRLRRALVSIKDEPAETVLRRDIRKILNETNDRGAPREAEKQRQSIGAMFAFAVSQDITPQNPVRGLQSYSSGEYRDRILAPAEIKTFWDWLPSSGMAPDYVDALRLQFCMGTRQYEGMTSGERLKKQRGGSMRDVFRRSFDDDRERLGIPALGNGGGGVKAELSGSAEVTGEATITVRVEAGSELLRAVESAKSSARLTGQLTQNGPGSTGKSSPDAGTGRTGNW